MRREGFTEHIPITLAQGDVLVMQGSLQKLFEHSVLSIAESELESGFDSIVNFLRYNLTSRLMQNHTTRCKRITQAHDSAIGRP